MIFEVGKLYRTKRDHAGVLRDSVLVPVIDIDAAGKHVTVLIDGALITMPMETACDHLL